MTVDFDGGRVSSDGGAVLVGRLDRSYGYLQRFSSCFTDHRDADLIEHSLLELLRQRIYGLTLGYEDLNDHDQLCRDPLLASVCGKRDVEGEHRQRHRDQGKALAGKSTLNRLELTLPQATAAERYKKVVADSEAIETFFIAEYVRSLAKDTEAVVLDLDATDDPLHGQQEGRFFHGYYGDYCYLPLYIFGGDWPVLAWLRTSDRDASDGAREKVEKIVAALRKRFPRLEITLRADSGFCRDGLMSWCEDHGVHYVFGLARNAVLQRELADALSQAQALSEADGGAPARVFHEFTYAAKTWERRRRVIGKAEWTQGEANPRFIITNRTAEGHAGRTLYEKFYCARGGHGEPDQGAATRSVRGSNQHRDDASQPTAAVVLDAGVSVIEPAAARGPGGHGVGASHVRDDPAEVTQDRRGGAHERATGGSALEQRLAVAIGF